MKEPPFLVLKKTSVKKFRPFFKEKVTNFKII